MSEGAALITELLPHLALLGGASLGLAAMVVGVNVAIKWMDSLSAQAGAMDWRDHEVNDANEWEEDRSRKYGGWRDVNIS